MATLAKMVTKTLDVGVSNTTIDLSATIKSFDVLDTKFIFGITSNQGLAINLSGATVKYIVEYYVEGKIYAIEGNCLVVDINTISFNLPDQLRGYNGKALIGIYATLTDGTKIDIKNIVVNIEPSLMDKGTDFKARYYFESFDNVLASVKDAGNKAISQINTVLPGVQSKVAEIDRQIKSLPPIPDLYVAYADNLAGGGFSKTDNTKLYKGYSVKNSTNPVDYRWERNGNNLQVGGRNYLSKSIIEKSNFYESNEKLCLDLSINKDSYVSFKSTIDLTTLVGKTVTFSFDSNMSTNRTFGIVLQSYSQITNIKAGRNSYTFIFPNFFRTNKYELPFDDNQRVVETGILELSNFKLELGTLPTDSGLSQEELILNSNPINSILTTLSAENPSTTLGGTWTQLGTETKFNNTIYYWKRTN